MEKEETKFVKVSVEYVDKYGNQVEDKITVTCKLEEFSLRLDEYEPGMVELGPPYTSLGPSIVRTLRGPRLEIEMKHIEHIGWVGDANN